MPPMIGLRRIDDSWDINYAHKLQTLRKVTNNVTEVSYSGIRIGWEYCFKAVGSVAQIVELVNYMETHYAKYEATGLEPPPPPKTPYYEW